MNTTSATAPAAPLHKRTPKKISSARRVSNQVQPQKVWLDAATRERVSRLHEHLAVALDFDASLSVLIRAALADFEQRVVDTLPNGAIHRVMISTEEVLALRVALLSAAAGQS